MKRKIEGPIPLRDNLSAPLEGYDLASAPELTREQIINNLLGLDLYEPKLPMGVQLPFPLYVHEKIAAASQAAKLPPQDLEVLSALSVLAIKGDFEERHARITALESIIKLNPQLGTALSYVCSAMSDEHYLSAALDELFMLHPKLTLVCALRNLTSTDDELRFDALNTIKRLNSDLAERIVSSDYSEGMIVQEKNRAEAAITSPDDQRLTRLIDDCLSVLKATTRAEARNRLESLLGVDRELGTCFLAVSCADPQQYEISISELRKVLPKLADRLTRVHKNGF